MQDRIAEIIPDKETSIHDELAVLEEELEPSGSSNADLSSRVTTAMRNSAALIAAIKFSCTVVWWLAQGHH